jgi:SET domain-containing protein
MIKLIRDVMEGEEIFISYSPEEDNGPSYWDATVKLELSLELITDLCSLGNDLDQSIRPEDFTSNNMVEIKSRLKCKGHWFI